MLTYTWVVLKSVGGGFGWEVTSRHATFDAGRRAHARLAREYDGFVLRPIDTGRLGGPTFQPAVGERVRLTGQVVTQLAGAAYPQEA